MGRGSGVFLRLSRLPELRQRTAGRHSVRAVARSRARLRRHHHARSCGVLRRWRLLGRHAGVLWRLERADHESGDRRCGGRSGRHALRARAPSHLRLDTVDAYALHPGAARGSRQYGPRLDRRLRWLAQPLVLAGVRPVRVQSALSHDAVSAHARRVVRLFRVRAHARVLAVRPEPDRHPRKPAAHACGRLAGAVAAGRLLCHLGGDRRRRRRAMGAEQRLRQFERARSRPRRHRADRAHSRRLRQAVRRVHRRRGLHGARAFSGADLSDRLAARPRLAAGADRAVRPQRHFGPRRRAVAALSRQLTLALSRSARRAMTEIRLETQALGRQFGALIAVADIDFRLAAGARHALIGPNGAGKTTFINLLTGVLRQAERVKLGIARTFQINRLFRGLSVLENVCIAITERLGAAGAMFYPAGRRTDIIDEAMQLLQTLKLAEAARHRVSELPYGRQRLVELAIAIALSPTVLLLDEPAAGVPSAESHIILDAIERLPENIAVLIIEHDMDVVFRFAKRVTVMVGGRLFAEGTPREIEAHAQVREVYLGQSPMRAAHG